MSSVGQILFTPRLALVVSACLLVGACGQRGDLYLPDSAAARERTRLPGLVRLPSTGQASAPAAASSASATSAAPAASASSPSR